MTNILKIALITVITLLIIVLIFILLVNTIINQNKQDIKGVYVYEQKFYQKRVC